MKKLLPILVVVVVIIALGIGITIYWRRHRHQTNKLWAANPCPNGLASMDNTIRPALKIDLLETNCENDVASVHFNVTNVGSGPIKYFEIRAIYIYDNYIDDGASVGTGPLGPGQSDAGYIGHGTPRDNGKSVGNLHAITLIPSLVEYDDGRKWRLPSIHEPTSK